MRPSHLAGHSAFLSWSVVIGAFAVPIVRFISRGLRRFDIAPSVKEGGGWDKLNYATGFLEYHWFFLVTGLVRDFAAIIGAGLVTYLRYKGIGPVKLHCYEAEAIVAGALGLYDLVYQARVHRQVNQQGKDLTKKEKRAAKIQALGILGPDVKDVLPKGR